MNIHILHTIIYKTMIIKTAIKLVRLNLEGLSIY